jgi:hypothetical protein
MDVFRLMGGWMDVFRWMDDGWMDSDGYGFR